MVENMRNAKHIVNINNFTASNDKSVPNSTSISLVAYQVSAEDDTSNFDQSISVIRFD